MPKGNRLIDLTGQTFGKLTVLDYKIHIMPSGGRKARWRCQCECGNTKTVLACHLRSGKTTSCGCLQQKWRKSGDANRTNGWTSHPMYSRWRGMVARCHNPKNKKYKFYGGRGITVCDEWRNDFMAYANHFGTLPRKMSVDRIDNDGPYSPDNCRVIPLIDNIRKANKAAKSKAHYAGERAQSI